MWFKNLCLYRLTQPLELDAERLAEALAADAYQPCGPHDLDSFGWVPPFAPHAEPLAHEANGCLLVAARRDEKLLPADVVGEVVGERVAAMEEAQGRRIGRSERARVKDDVVQELLPRAFVRGRQVRGYLVPAGRWLVVDAATAARAEDFTVLLRGSLGSLPVTPLAVRVPPGGTLTRWLQGRDLPAGFALGDECELRDPRDERSRVRCKGLELASEEVQAHCEAGMEVTRLALVWEERLAFLLGDDLLVRRLRPTDLLLERAGAEGPDDADALTRLDQDFALMTLEVGRLLEALVAGLGGEGPSRA